MGEHQRQNKRVSQHVKTTVASPDKKLLVKGQVRINQQTESTEVQRGDVIFTADGVNVGLVAAIVLDCSNREATHLLLGFVPPTAIYLLVPISMIDRIDKHAVWLKIISDAVESLPQHQPDD